MYKHGKTISSVLLGNRQEGHLVYKNVLDKNEMVEMVVVVQTETMKTCKAPIRSSHLHINTVYYRMDAHSVTVQVPKH